MVLSHGADWVLSLAVLADGRLASGGAGRQRSRSWPKEGTGEPVVLSHGSGVRSLAVLADGRLASGGEDGNIKMWPKEGTGEPVVLCAGQRGLRRVLSLAVLADGRLASGGARRQHQNLAQGGYGRAGGPLARQPGLVAGGAGGRAAGQRRRRRQHQAVAQGGYGRAGGPRAVSRTRIGRAAWVLSLAVLDGRAAGQRRRGRQQSRCGPRRVRASRWSSRRAAGSLSLAVLADGRLASGGKDGKIKLWPKEGTGEPVVLSHGSPVWSLAVLADGRLASGRRRRHNQALACRRTETDRRPLSSRRPQSYKGRVGPLHRLRHSLAAELPRPALELADPDP